MFTKEEATMRNTKSIFLVALSCSAILAGCNNHGSSEPSNTIDEQNYLLMRSNLLTPRVFLDSNFTVSGSASFKVADSKFDGTIQGEHFILDLNKETYNAETTEVEADTYYYDTDDEVWYHSKGTDKLSNTHIQTGLYFLALLPSSYSDLSYNESGKKYTWSGVMEETRFTIEFTVENNKLKTFLVISEMSIQLVFSDYGRTSVTIPSEYQEEVDN